MLFESVDDIQQIDIKSVDSNMIIEFFSERIPGILDFGIKVLIAIAIILAGRKLIRVMLKIVNRSLMKTGVNDGVIGFLDSIVRALLYMVLLLLIIELFGIPTTSFIALLGSAGLAIGLALQGSLSNFAGGVIILIVKPFVVGDYIIEDNKKNEGTVVSIELFHTRLLTSDNKVVVIPNGILANTSLTNVTAQDKRMISISVRIDYKADLKKAKEIIRELLDADEKVLKEDEISIFVGALEERAVVIGCKFWVHISDFNSTKWKVTEDIKLAFDENQIELPNSRIDISLSKQMMNQNIIG